MARKPKRVIVQISNETDDKWRDVQETADQATARKWIRDHGSSDTVYRVVTHHGEFVPTVKMTNRLEEVVA